MDMDWLHPRVGLGWFGKMLSVSVYEWICVWMLTRVEQIITAAHRDLQSYVHRPTNEP